MKKKISFLLLTSISIAASFLPVACKKENDPNNRNWGNLPLNDNPKINASHLLQEDKYWNLESVHGKHGSASIHVSYKGKKFYENMQIVNGKYKRLFIDDWYYTFDSSDILKDKNHTYAPTAPKSFSDYKDKVLGMHIYNSTFIRSPKTGSNNNPKDGIYCGSAFKVDKIHSRGIFNHNITESTDGKPLTGAKTSCSYEHVIPQSYINASKIPSKTKDYAKGDAHMLRPSINSSSKYYNFNNWRGHYLFGMLSLEPYKDVNVDFEVGTPSLGGSKLVEPKVNVRGDIARIHFYMHDRYHIMYLKPYYELFILWATLDPVTKEELEFEKKAAESMGFDNDYVTGKKQIPYSQAVHDHLKRFIWYRQAK